MFYRIVVLNRTFWRYLNSQVSINKMVSSLDSYSSPSRLALKKHPFIFLWTPKGFISLSTMLVEFSLKLLHSPCGKKFQSYGAHFRTKWIDSRDFYSCLSPLVPKLLSSVPRPKEITHSPRQHSFENLFPQ